MIKEIIVVEGRDDEQRVKRALDCEVVCTGGIYFGEKLLQRLKKISKDRGIIILTDPDYAGNKIRKRINDFIPDAKNAFVAQNLCIKDKDIGIENAKEEDILIAIENAHPSIVDKKKEYTMDDMIYYGLVGDGSKALRIKVGQILNIGYGNAKSFLRMLNNYNISREKLEEAINYEL
ncbi:ribonuclease M5 [uncultured Finegoldia sp.]|uniref:ribonuclease M5 n=1 Tax=uncultured Finegoldia sp. TaxID=328009 RepID=UPI0026154974|nr:ribonuclease M5 [uncultured Finegoldia sp.]